MKAAADATIYLLKGCVGLAILISVFSLTLGSLFKLAEVMFKVGRTMWG